MEFCKKPAFSMTDRQIEKPGKVHRCNILRSSFMNFYPIWSRACGEMASDGPTDRRRDRWTDYMLALRAAPQSNTTTQTGYCTCIYKSTAYIQCICIYINSPIQQHGPAIIYNESKGSKP